MAPNGGEALGNNSPIRKDESIQQFVQRLLSTNRITIFSKTYCPYCVRAKTFLDGLSIEYVAIELDTFPEGKAVQDYLKLMTDQGTVPNIFFGFTHVGGSSDLFELHEKGQLASLLNSSTPRSHSYEYDLVVIGGGSGGLACSREAAKLGMKVAVLDFVRPTPIGTTWGIGGTCVNVGCIPKKLMHQAALLRHALHDAPRYGHQVPGLDHQTHSWETMVAGVQEHIRGLNDSYIVNLRDENVEYLNARGEFMDDHHVLCQFYDPKTHQPTSTRVLSSNVIVVAVGGRPRYLGLPNNIDRELCITSDDLFSRPKPPGKTLIVGASYIALECGGFLTELGYDVTVMARSIFLRGYDQEIAEKIVDYMFKHGTKFLRECIPTNMEKAQSGRVRVHWKSTTGFTVDAEFDTVILAIGRDADTSSLQLTKAGIQVDSKTGKIIVDSQERTNVENIYAIGDVCVNRPELTPVAIQAGKYLSRRLFKNSKEVVDYVNVPTTVFTPVEYGCIGMSEEAAIEKFGEDDIETYHGTFTPLEWTVAKREEQICFSKLVCLKSQNMKVVGFHYFGPNAAEVTQGYAVAMRLGATKSDFDNTIGIHPSTSEEVIKLNVTKSSGVKTAAGGC